ncbi:Serine/threonine-protein kinase HT1 [Leucoagaricus sp. SymC.cos]|nr:Serine/threonine-protein kinase HT1 [Leucoagaricus sp. SymC.cos]
MSLPTNLDNTPTHSVSLLEWLDEDPLDGGNHCDIYKRRLNGKLVVIKHFRGVNPNRADVGDRLKESLKKESIRWMRLNHPSVCRVYMIAESFNCLPAVVMDYHPRGSLNNHITEHDPPFDQRRQWVLEMAQGLSSLHSSGVCHGSLRSSNVFLDTENRAVLADYGISQYINDSDFTQTRFNDLVRWTGPEVISPAPDQVVLQDKLDIYALGMTMLEVFTGKPPFSDIPSHKVPSAISENTRPMLPESIASNAELKDVFDACIRAVPNERPGASEVTAQLMALT